ncbi:MAG: hypothetical protein EON93_20890 [Burkholderiales bacterium]|nr:MAG: hypothetical protein EON93_20890 [Burkholderiales bacterium]
MSDHFDFDRIDIWGPELTERLQGVVPAAAMQRVAESAPDLIEDARGVLLRQVDPDSLNLTTSQWVSERPIAAYHGSRLTEQDIASIQLSGLKPLNIEDRRARLVRTLSRHEGWPANQHRLDEAIELFGTKQRAGRREGQVHLTLSRAGMLKSFSHYMTHGAEVDQHLANHVLGEAGIDLLQTDGSPVVIRCLIPAVTAIAGMNRYQVEGAPNPVPQVLKYWAYWLAKPNRAVAHIRVDCGIVLKEQMPPDWISGIERMQDEQLKRK